MKFQKCILINFDGHTDGWADGRKRAKSNRPLQHVQSLGLNKSIYVGVS